MKDFLTFRRMISPVIIQVIFWVGLLVFLAVGVGLIVEGAKRSRDELLWLGIAVCLVGPLVWRIYCEVTILFFRMNETLTDIRNRLEQRVHLDEPKDLQIPVGPLDKAAERRLMPRGCGNAASKPAKRAAGRRLSRSPSAALRAIRSRRLRRGHAAIRAGRRVLARAAVGGLAWPARTSRWRGVVAGLWWPVLGVLSCGPGTAPGSR